MSTGGYSRAAADGSARLPEAIDLLQDVEPHFDLEVGRDADEVTVEGGVVELTERETGRM
jgi:hypothetical protein